MKTKYRILKEEKQGYYTIYFVQRRMFFIWFNCNVEGNISCLDFAPLSVHPDLDSAKNKIAYFKYINTNKKKMIIQEVD